MYICNMKALHLLVKKLWLRLKCSKSRSNVKVTGSKILVSITDHGKVLSQGMYICNLKALHLLVKKLRQRLKFFSKVGQTSRSRSLGQKLWYPWKGLVTRNTHFNYESFTYTSSWVIGKVKVFVHADADARGTTIALRTLMSWRAKKSECTQWKER